jgi:signal peptidase II
MNPTMKRFQKFHGTPFILSIFLIIADQVTKAWVVATIPQGTVRYSFLSDFLWICHVRNSAVGFSLGDSLPVIAKQILFIVVPLLLMGVLVVFLIRSKELSTFQRWMLAGIVGGGLGNLVDRIFRPEWVVDFVSVRVYGFLGFERWPTFNVADASIVVTGILLMIHLLFFDSRLHRKTTETPKEVSHE